MLHSVAGHASAHQPKFVLNRCPCVESPSNFEYFCTLVTTARITGPPNPSNAMKHFTLIIILISPLASSARYRLSGLYLKIINKINMQPAIGTMAYTYPIDKDSSSRMIQQYLMHYIKNTKIQ